MKSTVEIDIEASPVIVVRYPDTVAVEDFEPLFRRFAEICGSVQRVGWVIDLRAFNPVTASATSRKAFTDAFKRYRHVIEPATVCEARVIESTLTRGIATAVDWMRAKKFEAKNFGDFDSAKAWVTATVARA
ncbi:MAG: STAS/SEC14 domain-containing protein [Myxococcota bacterium]